MGENNLQKFIIEGGHALRGEVIPSGNKNAALPILSGFPTPERDFFPTQ
jgi:hypothetical protein